MKKTILLFSLVAGALTSYACTCQGSFKDIYSSTSEYTQEYFVVFENVKNSDSSITSDQTISFLSDQIGYFRIIKSINDDDGNHDGDTIAIVGGGNGGMCKRSVNFEKHDSLIVSVNKSSNEYWMSTCRESFIYVNGWSPNQIDEAINSLKRVTTNISDSDLTNGIKLFPNPMLDKLHVESSISTIRGIEVLTTDGNLLQSYEDTHAHKLTVPMNNLSSGQYLIRLTMEDKVIIKKITK